MKKSIILLGSILLVTCLLALTAYADATRPKKFRHPAILNSKASLDLISQEVDKGDPARVAAYKQVEAFIERSDYPTSFFATVVVGSNGATSPSKSQIRRDAELVYAYALAWAKTGKPEYAEKTIGLINGWSYAFKNYDLLNAATNKRQPGLEACWTTPGFVAAAEIMRHYKVNGQSAGWKEADIAQFGNYLRTVVREYINVMPVYNNNWNASQGYAKMAIGIFLDSTALYQEGYDITKKFMPIIIKENGDIPEYCDRKDCVHFQYSLTAFSYAAQLAQLQGDHSLWELGNRLMARGYDYMRKAWDNQAECAYCSASSKIFPGTEVAANYYKTANLDYLRQLQAPLGWPGDYTFLGFTTYTHYKVPFK